MTSAAGSKHRHVVPNPGRGWVVLREAATSASVIEPEQAEAVRLARRVARRQGGGEVIVHRPDGRIEAGDAGIRKRRKPRSLGAARGAAMIFDFAGLMHPGSRRAQDPWAAAADDVANAWRTVGDLLDETMKECRDGPEPDVGSSVA